MEENTKAQADDLELKLNEDENHVYKVFICMRYLHPFADEVVESIKQFDPDEVILLPLYPQYSTNTTKKHGLKCNTKIIHHYYDNENLC